MSRDDEAHKHVQQRFEELQRRLEHATAEDIELIRAEARYLTNIAFELLSKRSLLAPAPEIDDVTQPPLP